MISICTDLSNKMPNESCYCCYPLELINPKGISVELDLNCRYNNLNFFEAIFDESNRYRFTKILPETSHSYLRFIIMDQQKKRVRYGVTDRMSTNSETFDFPISDSNFVYTASNQFTGMEWFNQVNDFPFPIRFEVEISELMAGIPDATDSESLIFLPLDALKSYKDESGCTYPISFHDVMLKDGCLSYVIRSGTCKNGKNFNCF